MTCSIGKGVVQIMRATVLSGVMIGEKSVVVNVTMVTSCPCTSVDVHFACNIAGMLAHMKVHRIFSEAFHAACSNGLES